MRLFGYDLQKLNSTAASEPGPSSDWRHQYVEFGQALLTLLQQYRCEIQEIQTRQFLESVNGWKTALTAVESPEELDRLRQESYEKAGQHLKKEKSYLEEREVELKNMISVLSEAIASVSAGNGEYHQRIIKTTQTLSQISLLEDIKKLRSSLTTEVMQLKEAVKEKQSQERQQFEQLSQSIDSLQNKLKTAVSRSMRDPLTGLYNREGWEQQITEVCHRASVTHKPFAVAIVDIDNFKQINDNGGHQVGDVILVKLGEFLKESFRAEDFVARLGGDEFSMILMAPSLEIARKLVDRLCKHVSKPTYSCPVNGKEFYLKVSISCGISLYRSGDSPETVLRRADEALYTAKKDGKNKVVTELELEAKTA